MSNSDKMEYSELYEKNPDWKFQNVNSCGNKLRNRIIKNLFSKIKLSEIGRVLDVGCGNCFTLDFLRNEFPLNEYHGIDVAIHQLNEFVIDRFQVQILDIEKVIPSLWEGAFDIILCFEVLEHLKNDKKALLNMAKLLHNNGYLLLSVPVDMKKWSNSDVENGHFRRYDLQDLYHKVRKDFEIIEIKFLGGFCFDKYIKYLRMVNKGSDSSIVSSPSIASNGWYHKILNEICYILFATEYLLGSFLKYNYGVFILAKKK